MFILSPTAFENKAYYNYGEEEAVSIRVKGNYYETVVRQDIVVEASSGNNNSAECPLDANTVYRVTFEGVDVLEGQTKGVGLRLYNKTSKKVLKNIIFDIAYSEATNGFNWTFQTPDTQDELELLFFAGIYGSTAGNSVIYQDVMLERLTNGDS